MNDSRESDAREGGGVATVADEMKLLAMAFPRADLQHGGAAIATLCTEIDKWADRLTDAMQAQQGAEPVAWQPIESAPAHEGGTAFVSDGEKVAAAFWGYGLFGRSKWCGIGTNRPISFTPTHWHPYWPATGAPR